MSPQEKCRGAGMEASHKLNNVDSPSGELNTNFIPDPIRSVSIHPRTPSHPWEVGKAEAAEKQTLSTLHVCPESYPLPTISLM